MGGGPKGTQFLTGEIERGRECVKRVPPRDLDDAPLDIADTADADPREVGQDRIVNAAAAYARWKCGLIIVDLGTATTCDVVTPRGEYIGGTISPGIGIANDALHEKTALLPKVPIHKPKRSDSESFSSTASPGWIAVERSLSTISRGIKCRRLEVA